VEALGYVPRDDIEDDWVVLIPAEGAGPQLSPGLSETPTQKHPRIHLDLYAGDAADQAAEVERLISLGAQQVVWDLYPEDPDFVVPAHDGPPHILGSAPCAIEGRGRRTRPPKRREPLHDHRGRRPGVEGVTAASECSPTCRAQPPWRDHAVVSTSARDRLHDHGGI